jgi:uncharacterized repeat protein (TIGR01451 family)
MKFSHDGSLLMAASNSQILVWRVADLLLVQNITFPYQTYYDYNSALSSNGQFVAHGAPNSASVWRVNDGSLVATFPADCGQAISFTQDSQSLVCAGAHVAVYGLPEGVPLPYPTGNNGSLNAIAYSPAGNILATAGSDSLMSIWDTAAGRVVSQVNLNGNNTISGIAFSPDGTKLAKGVGNNVSVWNTSGYGVAATLTGHSQQVNTVAFSPDGTLIASGSASPEQVVKVWSTQTWTLVRTLVGASGGILAVQFSPDGKKLVASCTDGTAREWNVTTGAVAQSYLAAGQGDMRIQYSPDGTRLAAGWNGKVLVFNTGTLNPVQTLNAHTANETTVAWSPDGKRLISGNPDGTVDVWDTSTWGQLSQYNSETYAQNGGVLTVAYSPDNSQFAYGRADSIVVAVDSGSAPTGTLTTVTTSPAGLNIVVDGATTASPQTFRWAAGSTHTIGAPSPQGSSGTRNIFGNWSDGGAQTHTITTPSTGTTYTAQFNQQYLLTPSVSSGGGSILVSPTSIDGYYDSGTTVQAVATPNLGYVFGTWSGAATGTTNPATVSMTAPQSIVASFGALPTTVVTTNPPGLLMTVDGTQYTGPQSFNWTTGSSHTVAVASEQGSRSARYAFANWADGGNISHAVTAPSASTTYTANFNSQFPLATNSNPAGGGTITANPSSADGYYNSGSDVQLTATPAAGYYFASWSGDITGTISPATVTMSAARSVTANFAIITNPVLSITKTHAGNFTKGQGGASYTVTVSNTGTAATSGTVTVTEALPSGLTLISMSGLNWNCAANVCTRSDVLGIGASYQTITVTVNVAYTATSPQVNQVSASGGGSVSATATDSTTIVGLRFVPITPCRVADTRNANGPFGGPSITGGTSRSLNISANTACGVPATAQAYSLNVAVVPHGALGYLTAWPTGQTQPVAATVSSVDGRVRSNAAIVPAGTGGSINMFASNTTDMVLDINGYFVNDSTALAFYPVAPCRVVDTRSANGALGGPFLTGGASRTFPIPTSSCNLPTSAQAYSLNLAAVPKGPLGYLTAWPTGQSQPGTANLSSTTGTVTASAAIVPAGTNGSIDVYASNSTDLVIDVNGYFAPAGTGGLSLYTLPPCRVLDTRNSNGGQPFSGELDENVQASSCGVPAGAQAYVLNATVVPTVPLGYLTLWSQGTAQPSVATLSAVDATVTSNLAIVPTSNGSIGTYASNPTQLILDIFGYFAP